MLLFLINGVFIILATYIMTKYLRFKEAEYPSPAAAKRTRTLMTVAILAVTIPSLWSAILMVGENNFERNVQSFVAENKNFSQGYIYDYKILGGKGKARKVEVFYAGNKLSDNEKTALSESASRHGIAPERLDVRESDFGSADNATDRLLKGLYERADDELARKNAEIDRLQQEIYDLKGRELNYKRIAREVRYSYPDIKDITISKGATVDDSLRVKECTIVLATSVKPLPQAQVRKVEDWLKMRLEDSTTVVHNIVGNK